MYGSCGSTKCTSRCHGCAPFAKRFIIRDAISAVRYSGVDSSGPSRYPHIAKGSDPGHRIMRCGVARRGSVTRGTRSGFMSRFLQQLGVAAVNPGNLVEAEIERRSRIARVPLARVAQPVTRVAQPLGIQHHVRVHIAMHRGRRMHLVVDAVVPVIGAAQQHGARRAADRRRCIAALEQHALACQAVDIRRAAARPSRDRGPLLLVRHDVQDVGTRGPSGSLRRGRDSRGAGQKASAIQCVGHDAYITSPLHPAHKLDILRTIYEFQ